MIYQNGEIFELNWGFNIDIKVLISNLKIFDNIFGPHN